MESAVGVAPIETALRERTQLDDFALRVRVLDGPGALVVESAAGLLSDDVVAAAGTAAAEMQMGQQPILTYLANAIRLGDRITPYSLVTALDVEGRGLDTVVPRVTAAGAPPKI